MLAGCGCYKGRCSNVKSHGIAQPRDRSVGEIKRVEHRNVLRNFAGEGIRKVKKKVSFAIFQKLKLLGSTQPNEQKHMVFLVGQARPKLDDIGLGVRRSACNRWIREMQGL